MFCTVPTPSAAKALVIVESPAKANTIARFLGDGFVVESSIGHIRDLPRSAADVPARYKELPWARLGIDVDNASSRCTWWRPTSAARSRS